MNVILHKQCGLKMKLERDCEGLYLSTFDINIGE